MDSENILSETVSDLYEKVNANNLNTCKECKWWRFEHSEIGVCQSKEATEKFAPDNHYIRRMPVHKDFGCIHWEKKDE